MPHCSEPSVGILSDAFVGIFSAAQHAATWSRDIATAVGDALRTPVTGLTCYLTLHERIAAPWLLHTGFRTAGHTVAITVAWDDPCRPPAFALRLDNQPVALDADRAQRPAVVLAHAASQAIAERQAAMDRAVG
jgi:hypothetical protein